MSAVIIGLKDSENQITTLIQDNPTVLFNTPTQPTYIGIQTVDDDTNKYYVTLYTNNYKINLSKTTHISYNEDEREGIINQPAYVQINTHNNDFYRGTVQIRPTPTNITFNKLINLFDENEIVDCAELLNDYKQYNIYKSQQYQELETSCRSQISEFQKKNWQFTVLNIQNENLKSQNKEFKKQIDTNNQNNKISIIICVIIIMLLLGLCIYLYSFKL